MVVVWQVLSEVLSVYSGVGKITKAEETLTKMMQRGQKDNSDYSFSPYSMRKDTGILHQWEDPLRDACLGARGD